MQKQNSVLRNKVFDIREMDFPKLSQTEVDGKRFYLTPTGEKYPSVTTVLSAMSDKKWLYEWKARVGNEEANRITARSTGRGTSLHSVCEKYLRNEEEFCVKKSIIVEDMFKSIQPIINKIDIIFGNECAVYSHELKTAGKFDCFCEMKGEKVILDFKTSTRRKEEQQIINYFLQATAYAIMIEEITSIKVPTLAILIAVEEDEPQLFIKKTSKYKDQVYETFNKYHSGQRL